MHLQLLSISDSQFNSSKHIVELFSQSTSLLALIIENTNTLRHLISYQFRKFHQLRYLNIQRNAIDDVPKFAFYGLINVANLDMHNIKIHTINDYSFYGMNALRILDLSENYISSLPPHSFHGLNSLKKLELQGNNVWTINVYAFQSFLGTIKVEESSVCCFAALPSNCSHIRDTENLSCQRLLPKYLKYCFHLVCIYLLVIFIVSFSTKQLWQLNDRFLIAMMSNVNNFLIFFVLIMLNTLDYVHAHEYPIRRSFLKLSVFCYVHSVISIVSLILPKVHNTVITCIYYRVTVYALVKQAYSTLQIGVSLLIALVLSIVISVGWTLIVLKFTFWFCTPFVNTITKSPTNGIIIITIFYLTHISSILVDGLLSFFIYKHLRRRDKQFGRCNKTVSHSMKVGKRLMLFTILRVLVVILLLPVVASPLLLPRHHNIYLCAQIAYIISCSTADFYVYTVTRMNN